MADDIYFGDKGRKRNSHENNSPQRTNPYIEKLDADFFDDGQVQAYPEQRKASQKSSASKKAPPKKKKKRKNKGIKILTAAVSLILVIILLVTGGAFASYSYIIKDYEAQSFEENEYVSASQLLQSDGVYNLLMIGIDTMDTNDSSRSDAMIVLSVDSKNKNLKLTSFMRDSYVNIPGYGFTKLNAACTYGGPQLVADTIEYNFGLKIDAYAKIGYDVFIEIVDGIGGLTIPEVDATEAAALALEGYYVEPGENIEMTGEQALLYCRIRKGQSDFNRTERQRETITLIIEKALKTNPVKLLNIASSVISKMQCSIDKSEFFSLAFKALPCVIGGIEQARIPADDTWYNDTRNSQAVLVVDFDLNREYIENFIYE